jgi:hypothetical protein
LFTLKRLLLATAVVALAVSLAACSDNGEPGDSTTVASGSAEDVVFGSGELPATIPEEFPLPAGSAVGSTMVVTQTGFTEVIARISAEQGLTVAFFEQELPQAGFTIDNSTGDDAAWLIEFSLDGAKGTIDVTEPVQGISQAVIRYNVP